MCIAGPKVTPPVLPSPLAILPPSPAINFAGNICCKSVQVSAKIPLPALLADLVNPALIAAANDGMAKVCTFINALAIKCPREA